MPSAAADFPVAILAGGLATRLRPFTEKIPKVLLDVAGQPFLTHQLDLLRQARIKRVVICVGHFSEQVVIRFPKGNHSGLDIDYSWDGSKLRGTGGALIHALPKLGDSFYVLYGDSYLPTDYQAVGRAFQDSGRLGLMTVYENQGRYETSNVWFESGEIKRYDKKHPLPQMHHVDYGLGVFRAQAFDGFSRDMPVDLAEVQMSLVAHHQLAGYEIKERFYEIGSPSGLKELDALLRAKHSPPR